MRKKLMQYVFSVSGSLTRAAYPPATKGVGKVSQLSDGCTGRTRSLCNFLFVKMFLKFDEQSTYVCHVS